jgi:ankyrin repeat protein
MLLAGHRAGDAHAIELIHQHHPSYRREDVKWLPQQLDPSEIRANPFTLEDARLTVARAYCFLDWESLAEYATAVNQPDSPVARFEAAVEAVIHGGAAALARLLEQDPSIAQGRSSRAAPFDPPRHQATLLHYLVANGVENHRQKTPSNAVEIAKLLFAAGADVNACAHLYGGLCAPLSMLVSSSPPQEAQVQIPLVELFAQQGADLDSSGKGNWSSPLVTALVFGFTEAAEALVRCGAKVDTLPKAAGLARAELAESLLPAASALEKQQALALAAPLGHAAITERLLQAGADPNLLNPEGFHAHCGPLHQAAHNGHLEVARILVRYGASTTALDSTWNSMPLGWAQHGNQAALVDYLSSL